MFNNKKSSNSLHDSNLSSNNFNTAKLQSFIEDQVFDILTGIKEQIQFKIKEIDKNIHNLHIEIGDIKKVIFSKGNNHNSNSPNSDDMKLLTSKVQRIEKQLHNMKTSICREDYSNFQGYQSKTTPYKQSLLNQFANPNQTQRKQKIMANTQNARKIQKQQMNAKNFNIQKDQDKKYTNPIFKKTNNQVYDFSSIILDQQKEDNLKIPSLQDKNLLGKSYTQNQINTQKRSSSNSNSSNLIQTLKRPPLPSSQDKSKNYKLSQINKSTAYDFRNNRQTYSNESDFSTQPRKNKIMQANSNKSQNSAQKLQKQLSKNKSVFIRKKKSEQTVQVQKKEEYNPKMNRNLQNQKRIFQTQKQNYKFHNQLQDFSNQKEEESFNIQLQYSKDTFLSEI